MREGEKGGSEGGRGRRGQGGASERAVTGCERILDSPLCGAQD